MKWHKKMGIMSACGLSLLTMSGLAMSLTSCSKKEVKPEVVPYQYNYMQDMRLMLSDKAKLTVNNKEERCLLFQINDQNEKDIYKAWFILIEDIKNNELFLSFQGWCSYELLEENKKWSGKIPEEINLINNNIDLTYNDQKIESLPVKAVNIGDLSRIPDWNEFHEYTKNAEWDKYNTKGIYVDKRFFLAFQNAKNIEYICPDFTIFDDNTNKNNDNNENINFKFPSSIKCLIIDGSIEFDENSFNNIFPNIILDLSDCNKLVEIEKFKDFTSDLRIQNLIEIKLSPTIKRYSGSIFRKNPEEKIPVKINLENLLFIDEDVFYYNYFPNNEVVLNEKCLYYTNTNALASFNSETKVIGGIINY